MKKLFLGAMLFFLFLAGCIQQSNQNPVDNQNGSAVNNTAGNQNPNQIKPVTELSNLGADENVALTIAETNDGFKLFLNFTDLYKNYITHYLTKYDLLGQCDQNKLLLLEQFANGKKVTVQKIKENFYEIKTFNPMIFNERSRSEENRKNERTIIVDTRDKKIISSDFYTQKDGFLLYHIFDNGSLESYGFKQSDYLNDDLNKMSEEFVATFCKISEKNYQPPNPETPTPQAIDASFSENPLDIAKGSSFTKLSVTITNITSKNAPNVQVEVIPENTKDINVTPNRTDVGLIDKGNERITEFIIQPNPTAKGGKYPINVYAVINGERFQKQMELKINPNVFACTSSSPGKMPIKSSSTAPVSIELINGTGGTINSVTTGTATGSFTEAGLTATTVKGGGTIVLHPTCEDCTNISSETIGTTLKPDSNITIIYKDEFGYDKTVTIICH